jgi:hypothetical protein
VGLAVVAEVAEAMKEDGAEPRPKSSCTAGLSAVAVMKDDGAWPRPKSSCAGGLTVLALAAMATEENGA